MSIRGIVSSIRLHFSKELISAYADNELDRSSRNRLQRLLDGSAGARAYYERMSMIQGIINAVPERQPPGDLKQRIDSAILNMRGQARYSEPAHVRHPMVWVYAGTFAAVLLAVVTVIGIHRLKTRPGVPESSMLASIDMYQNMGLYEHMDMIEHLDEVMAVDQPEGTLKGAVR
ncbi:MAG: hypothetical protein M1491_06505 [Deltaproteobacteria bacterium]|nr:hypothetical protein [Deltaproteobacteria bacterium]MCL5276247.1 hypothetical protein [Deltaproteobacteria bacterium]